MVDQLADPNKFPPGRTLYDTLVGWGVGTSINTHDGVFFKAGFEPVSYTHLTLPTNREV